MMLKSFFHVLLFSCFAATACAQGEQEANLKAAFIYNFTKYIDWNFDATETNENDFVIGVIGNSPVTASLNEIAKENRVGYKRIVVRVFNSPEDIGSCNILFIPRRSPFSLRSILEKVRKGTLTISEEAGFARQGTAFNFVIINDKLKFETNLKAIASAGLKAGSQLLKLAIIVDNS
jgi:hypothetical protein